MCVGIGEKKHNPEEPNTLLISSFAHKSFATAKKKYKKKTRTTLTTQDQQDSGRYVLANPVRYSHRYMHICVIFGHTACT